jgi:hypothetical protein
MSSPRLSDARLGKRARRSLEPVYNAERTRILKTVSRFPKTQVRAISEGPCACSGVSC